MKNQILISSLLLLITANSCSEETPVQPILSEALKVVYSIDNDRKNKIVISQHSNIITEFDVISDSFFAFLNSNKLFVEAINNSFSTFTTNLYTPEGLSIYENGRVFVFGNSGEIYMSDDFGITRINLTNTPNDYERFPILNQDDNSVIYSKYNFNSYYSYLEKIDLSTLQKTILYTTHTYELFPKFITYSGALLIFFENRANDYHNGYLKSLNISNPSEIRILGYCRLFEAHESSISDDNKIVHTTLRNVILLDLNDMSEKVLKSPANFAKISKDGSTIVYSNDFGAYLIDPLGQNWRGIMDTNVSGKFAHDVAINSDGSKIVYVECEVPRFP